MTTILEKHFSTPVVGEVYLFADPLNYDPVKRSLDRPGVIIKVFNDNMSVIVVPLTTSSQLERPKSIRISSVDVLKKEAYAKVDHITTIAAQRLKLRLGRISPEELDSIESSVKQLFGGHAQPVINLSVDDRPQIMICGPHGNGSGIERLRMLANKITNSTDFKGFALIDAPNRPDLILKQKFQWQALSSHGVIVLLGNDCSGACMEYDWAAELSIFTVVIVNDNLPTEMLRGFDITKDNVNIIRCNHSFSIKAVEDAVEWIDMKVKERIARITQQEYEI